MKWVNIKDALPHRNEKVFVFCKSLNTYFTVESKNVKNVNGVSHWCYIEHPDKQKYHPDRHEQWNFLKQTLTDMVNTDSERFSSTNTCIKTLELVIDMMRGLE